jgi:hypothetical protein
MAARLCPVAHQMLKSIGTNQSWVMREAHVIRAPETANGRKTGRADTNPGEERMDLHREFEGAHAEHADILEFLNIWEDALKLIASDDCDTRCHGLRQLQAMEGKIVEIWEHCHKEEDDPAAPLFRFAEPADRERLKEEHFRLYRANYEFRREMEYTTSSFTGDLVLQGQMLLAALREHIAYEEELLRRFEHDQLHLHEAVAPS